MSSNGVSSIWKRVMAPGLDDLKPAVARALLEMKFNDRDLKRIHYLSGLARRGALSEAQAYELDVYLNLGNMLGILHSKARVALRRQGGSARLRRNSA